MTGSLLKAVVVLLLILLTEMTQVVLADYRDQRLAKIIVRLAGVQVVPDALLGVGQARKYGGSGSLLADGRLATDSGRIAMG